LRAHDLRGNPAAVLGSLIVRIDRLKSEGVTQADHAAWAASLDASADASEDEATASRAAREREFAQLFADHDRMLAEAGMLDAGDVLRTLVDLLRRHAHV